MLRETIQTLMSTGQKLYHYAAASPRVKRELGFMKKAALVPFFSPEVYVAHAVYRGAKKAYKAVPEGAALEGRRRIKQLGRDAVYKVQKLRGKAKPRQYTFKDVPWSGFESQRRGSAKLREVEPSHLKHVSAVGKRRRGGGDRTAFHRFLIADFLKRLQGGR